jgi:hypothetical protein
MLREDGAARDRGFADGRGFDGGYDGAARERCAHAAAVLRRAFAPAAPGADFDGLLARLDDRDR